MAGINYEILQMNPIYAVRNFNNSDIYRIELNSAIMDGSASFFSFKIDGSYLNSYQKIKLQQAQESIITLRN